MGKLTVWLVLAFPITVLLGYTAYCGALRPGVYRLETPSYAAQGIGQDLSNLFVVLPIFVTSLVYSWRESLRAVLVLAGILAYLVYSYAMYAITLHFNSLFLLYVSCFGLSLYSLIGILVSVDSEALKRIITRKSTHKLFRTGLASFFMLVAALFYILWLSEIVAHLRAGTTPHSIVESGLPSNMVHVLDIGVVLPLFVLTALWLLSNSRFGYLFAPVLLNFTICMAVSLTSMICFMYIKGVTETLAPCLLFIALFIISLGFDSKYLGLLPKHGLELREDKQE